MLKFRGSQHLRQRLICATLSGKAIRVDGIRDRDQNPGLRDYEACLLRLIEKVTDGCVIEINETGDPDPKVTFRSNNETSKVCKSTPLPPTSACLLCPFHARTLYSYGALAELLIPFRNKPALQAGPSDGGFRL